MTTVVTVGLTLEQARDPHRLQEAACSVLQSRLDGRDLLAEDLVDSVIVQNVMDDEDRGLSTRWGIFTSDGYRLDVGTFDTRVHAERAAETLTTLDWEVLPVLA